MPDPGSPRGVEGPVKAGKLVAVAELNAQNVNFLLGDGPRDGAPHAIAPRLPERQRTFAGREAELAEVHARLGRAAEVGITQQTAVHGHGGIGKTSLAVEYAWRHLADYPGGVFSLACDTAADVPPLHELAPYLGIPAAETTDDTAAAVRVRLERGEPALLILDNVRGAEQWQSRAWREALPGGACRRLITTRAPRLADVPMYALQRLSTEDGVALLALYRPDALASRVTVERVVEWFDGLAVGLTVVGIYMEMNPELPWAKYEASLKTKGLDAVRRTEGEARNVYEHRVDAVFDDVMEELPAAERRAVEYAALLPEDRIYPLWLPLLLGGDGGVELPDLPGYEGQGGEVVVTQLTRKQLLREQGDGSLGLHRVLRRRIREVLDGRGETEARIAAVLVLAEARGKASRAAVLEPAFRAELGSLVGLSEALAALGYVVEGVRLMNWLVTPLLDLGRYTEARALLASYATEATSLPSSAAATLHSNVATILKALGELGEAREMMVRAIAIEEEHFAADHPTLAVSYSNLATILKALGELREARKMITRAIAIEEKHFAADHPNLAIRYNNLGQIELDAGHREAACELFRRAMAILRTHFTESHPQVRILARTLAHACGEAG